MATVTFKPPKNHLGIWQAVKKIHLDGPGHHYNWTFIWFTFDFATFYDSSTNAISVSEQASEMLPVAFKTVETANPFPQPADPGPPSESEIFGVDLVYLTGWPGDIGLSGVPPGYSRAQTSLSGGAFFATGHTTDSNFPLSQEGPSATLDYGGMVGSDGVTDVTWTPHTLIRAPQGEGAGMITGRMWMKGSRGFGPGGPFDGPPS